LLRALVTSVLLVTAYYVLPFDHITDAGQIAVLVIGLAALVVLITVQVRAILRAAYPGARAIEALAMTTPLFLLLFASTYYLLGHTTPSDFSQRMTRTDALYFTMTTFTTTGFGDITATSEGARLIVTGQMLLDLLLLGFGVRVFVGAVRLGQEARAGAGARTDTGGS
jgi:voltage-gated potassium channel